MDTCAELWTGESLQGTTGSAYVHQTTSCSSIPASPTHLGHLSSPESQGQLPTTPGPGGLYGQAVVQEPSLQSV